MITHSSLVNVVKIIILYKFVPIEIFQPRSSFLCSERYLGGVCLRVGGGGLRATESPLVANVFGGERIRQLERRRSTQSPSLSALRGRSSGHPRPLAPHRPQHAPAVRAAHERPRTSPNGQQGPTRRRHDAAVHGHAGEHGAAEDGSAATPASWSRLNLSESVHCGQTSLPT